MTELPTEQTTSQTYRNAFLVAAVLWGISFQFMPLFELSGVLVKVQHLLLLFFCPACRDNEGVVREVHTATPLLSRGAHLVLYHQRRRVADQRLSCGAS